MRKSIRRKFVVTLKSEDVGFAGIMVDCSGESMVFEQCDTVPVKDEQPQRIMGRVHVFVSNVAYLQEIP